MGILDGAVAGGTVLCWSVALQHPTSRGNDFLIYALAEDNDESAKAVEAALKAAQPGEFVCVPVRFMNLVHATNVYIQPHMWGMWCVVQQAIDVNQMYGSTA
ncbi:hypothetical protein ACJH6J_20350 [Mycobacterium sp. SMC-18]|uniref:hypothetical protein n=1 Tax=unclassified Mycobacterium TaxID=2642494 RepID=UPI00387708EC